MLYNSAQSPNHRWHAADRALIKETFSPCDFYRCEVRKKTNWATFLLDCRKIEHTSPYNMYLLLLVSLTTSFSESALRLFCNFLCCLLSLIFPLFPAFAVFSASTFYSVHHLSSPSRYLFSPLSSVQPLPLSNSSLPAACLGLSELRWVL